VKRFLRGRVADSTPSSVSSISSDDSCRHPAIGIFLSAASPATAAELSFTLPARDNGCAVDLQVDVDSVGPGGPANITITNLATGASYLQRSRYTETVTFDPTTRSEHIEVIGNKWIRLYPGEPGPDGVVREPGAELLVSGTLEYTLDRKGVLTAFSLNGTYDDLCALLSEF
jgi:hypothetical protein